jgi:lipopolysaccharide export LptBFGC system permease protein LptF
VQTNPESSVRQTLRVVVIPRLIESVLHIVSGLVALAKGKNKQTKTQDNSKAKGKNKQTKTQDNSIAKGKNKQTKTQDNSIAKEKNKQTKTQDNTIAKHM